MYIIVEHVVYFTLYFGMDCMFLQFTDKLITVDLQCMISEVQHLEPYSAF